MHREVSVASVVKLADRARRGARILACRVAIRGDIELCARPPPRTKNVPYVPVCSPFRCQRGPAFSNPRMILKWGWSGKGPALGVDLLSEGVRGGGEAQPGVALINGVG